jgi:uncharacterized phage protein gp47/JayE
MATEFAVTAERLPTVDEIRDQLLNDLRYRYARQGVTVNVKRGSAHYKRCEALANRISLALANGQLRLRDIDPYKATGDALIKLARFFGVTGREASKASGFVTVTLETGADGSVSIPIGYKATSPAGITYQTTAAYPTAITGDTVAVESVDAGDVDAAAGTFLTWDSASVANLKPKSTVAAGGIDGGREADDEEELRVRLLRRLGFPVGGGNWSFVAQTAEDASASVDQAFVYPTMRGPSSYDVAIVGDADGLVLNVATQAIAAATVRAAMPGSIDEALNLTSVALEPLDAVIDMSTPYPVLAGGAGGGWTDSSPWPSDAENGANVWAEVTAVGSNSLTVNSTSADPPAAGNRFAVWNADDEALYEFSAVGVGGSSGAYVITVDSQQSALLGKVVVGARCSAMAEKLQEYADAFVAYVKTLGPGEKTADADLLRYARRKPAPDVERPYALTTTALSAISNAHAEVFDVSYASRTATGTTTTQTTPSVPATTADAPNMITIQNLSVRAKV